MKHLPVPLDSIPNALGIAVHDFKSDDRALVMILNLAQNALILKSRLQLRQELALSSQEQEILTASS